MRERRSPKAHTLRVRAHERRNLMHHALHIGLARHGHEHFERLAITANQL